MPVCQISQTRNLQNLHEAVENDDSGGEGSITFPQHHNPTKQGGETTRTGDDQRFVLFQHGPPGSARLLGAFRNRRSQSQPQSKLAIALVVDLKYRYCLVMQLLMRHASRSVFDTLASSSASRAYRQVSSRQVPAIRASLVCLPCQQLLQRRRFADDHKPSLPLAPASNPPPQSAKPSPTDDLSFEPSDTTPQWSSQLPSAEERRRSSLSKRFSSIMDNLQGNIFIASQRLNDLTGYSGIEALKLEISKLEGRLAESQEVVRVARLTYKSSIADRAANQREVTALLARKDTWTPIDLERFTSLYRNDHQNEASVQEASTKLADAERVAEQTATKLNTTILSRYHEEGVLSDKIRRMSTWGTWGLMGVNILLFLVFQIGFEPYRRRRLVRGFEEKVHEALEREREKHGHHVIEGRMEGQATEDEIKLDQIVAAGIQELQLEAMMGDSQEDPACDALAAVIIHDASKGEFIPSSDSDSDTPETQSSRREWEQQVQSWKAAAKDLFSERVISLRKQDVTFIALEGAATGASIVGAVAIFLWRSR
jgi:sensitive to high expression protein 9